MSEAITTVWKSEKLVTIWADAERVIIQESEIIVKTTTFLKGKRELLDKSINQSENNISKCVPIICLPFFIVISTICVSSLQVIRFLFYVILGLVKSLFYVILVISAFLFYAILGIAKSLFLYVIKPVTIWLITMVASFSESMCKSINSLFVKIKHASVKHASVKHAVEKPLQLQIKLHQLIVPIVFSLLFVWIFVYSY